MIMSLPKDMEKFKCKTFEDYLKLYLFTDCLLLADVFDNFCDNAMKVYQLEVLHLISAAYLFYFLISDQLKHHY